MRLGLLMAAVTLVAASQANAAYEEFVASGTGTEVGNGPTGDFNESGPFLFTFDVALNPSGTTTSDGYYDTFSNNYHVAISNGVLTINGQDRTGQNSSMGPMYSGTLTLPSSINSFEEIGDSSPASGSILYINSNQYGGYSIQGTVNLITNVRSVEFFSDPSVQALPEPATWAMMIAGVGMAGAAMRRRRVSVRFA